MRIFHIFDQFPAPYQNYILNQLTRLNQCTDISLEIHAKHPLISEDHSFKKVLNIKKVQNSITAKIYNRIPSKKNLSYYEYILLKNKPDIIHVQQSYLFGLIENMSKIKADIRPKVVVSFRGSETFVKPWVGDYWREKHKILSKNADAIQVMSESQKIYLKKWGYSGDKIFVIPISIGTNHMRLVDLSMNTPIKICSVFRMVWEKNIEFNLRAIKKIISNGIDVEYNVFGDGPDLGQLFYLIDRFDLTNHVNIWGKIEPEELSLQLQKHHFLLQLSTSEALPASVLEAQSIGIPCIVSDSDGMPEVIKSGHNGYVVSFENYDLDGITSFLFKTLDSSDFYKSLRENSFKRFEVDFSPELETQRLIQMYSAIR